MWCVGGTRLRIVSGHFLLWQPHHSVHSLDSAAWVGATRENNGASGDQYSRLLKRQLLILWSPWFDGVSLKAAARNDHP